MGNKCHICGMIRKVIIRCLRCDNDVCIHDFYCNDGICADCMALDYEDKYKEKIERYEKENIFVGIDG